MDLLHQIRLLDVGKYLDNLVDSYRNYDYFKGFNDMAYLGNEVDNDHEVFIFHTTFNLKVRE
jgi:hypothetical protein